ncbi:MAG: hypothetical protein ABIO80_09490 [Sphingomicrobium sp.]
MRIAVPAALSALFIATAASSTTYPGWQSTIKYATTATAGACGSATSKACGFNNFTRATSSVVYDPVSDTYTVRDTGSLAIKSSFGPSDIDAGASDATFTVYKKGANETFRLLNQGPANPLIALTYVTYGQWRRTSTSGSVTSVNDTYVVFGSKSPSSAVISGTGNYATVLDGTFVNKTGAYMVSGTGTMTAFFDTGMLNYSATAGAVPETSGIGFSFGTMTGSGSIASRSATFKGTGTTNGSGYALDVNGGFYGPSAQEIGGVFRLRGNGGNGTGAIVGN